MRTREYIFSRPSVVEIGRHTSRISLYAGEREHHKQKQMKLMLMFSTRTLYALETRMIRERFVLFDSKLLENSVPY